MQQVRSFFRFFLWIFIFLPVFLHAESSDISKNPPVEGASNSLSAASTALPEVVITANRLDTPVSQVASSLTVITAKEMEKKQAGTVLDALSDAPGLTLLQNGAPGANTGIFIRGADSGHTLVLLDGIPLNNPMAISRDFEALDQLFVDDLDRIEVVRGPQSSLYGSNASAGVINIITQKGDKEPKGSFLFEGGSYDTFREAASASAGNELGNFSISASRFDTSGFPSADKSFGNVINSGDSNTTASLRLGILPSSNLENNFLFRFSQSRTNLADAGGAGGDDPNYFLEERQWVAGGQSKLELLNGDWEQMFGVSFTDDLQKFSDDLDYPSYPFSYNDRGVFEGQTAQASWQNNLRLWKGETLVAGLQGQQEWGREDDSSDYGDTFIDKSATTGSAFLESQTSLGDRFFASLSGRVDDYSSFGGQVTYKAAAAYFIPGLETKLKATYGTGFKAPSIYQLYSPYGNETLKAETSEGWDAGLEQPFFSGLLKAGATYFHNDFSNLIDFESTATPPYGEYFNVAEARTEGWETFISAKPLPDLELKADYTYTWAQDLQTGEALLRRPQNSANFSASYKWDHADFGFNVAYVGERPDQSFATFPATPVTMGAYTLVNLRVSYEVDSNVKLFARADNLFNEVYEEIYGYGTPGLSVYAGTKLSL